MEVVSPHRGISRQTIVPSAKVGYRHLNDFMRFRQKIHVSLEKKNFTVKTIETRRELVQALMLRYEVFHKEYIGKKFPIGIDTDRYDSKGDLLVIVDNKSKKIVGTYRLIPSFLGGTFYSSSEFDLGDFLAIPGIKLELSRACIHKNFRQGIVMSLLWRGISEYMQAIGAKYLFGCSSVKTTDRTKIAAVCQALEAQGAIQQGFNIRPRENYRIPNFDELSQLKTDGQNVDSLIPPLLSSYLRAGAKIAAEPALDSLFNCIDFLTILDIEAMSNSFDRKYRKRP